MLDVGSACTTWPPLIFSMTSPISQTGDGGEALGQHDLNRHGVRVDLPVLGASVKP